MQCLTVTCVHCVAQSDCDGGGVVEVSGPSDAVGAGVLDVGESFCIGEVDSASLKICFRSVVSAGDAAARTLLDVRRSVPARSHPG